MSNELSFVSALRQMLGLNTGSMIVSSALVNLLIKKGIITAEELEAEIKLQNASLSEGMNSDEDVEKGVATFLAAIKNAAKGQSI